MEKRYHALDKRRAHDYTFHNNTAFYGKAISEGRPLLCIPGDLRPRPPQTEPASKAVVEGKDEKNIYA